MTDDDDYDCTGRLNENKRNKRLLRIEQEGVRKREELEARKNKVEYDKIVEELDRSWDERMRKKEEEEERKKEIRIEKIIEKVQNFNSEIKQHEKNGPFGTIHFHKHVEVNVDDIPIDLSDTEDYDDKDMVDLSIDDKYEILQLVKKYKPNKLTVHIHKKLLPN